MSLNKPHIDHDNGPHTGNNSICVSVYLSIYLLSIYLLSHICHTLVPKICVCSEMLRVFWYIGVLMCQIYNCTQRLELLVSAMKIIDEDRYMNAQTQGINCRLSLPRQWSCSCPATCQCACVNQKQPMGLLYCCFMTFIIVDIGVTLNILQCLCVTSGCRAIQTKSAEASTALVAM